MKHKKYVNETLVKLMGKYEPSKKGKYLTMDTHFGIIVWLKVLSKGKLIIILNITNITNFLILYSFHYKFAMVVSNG